MFILFPVRVEVLYPRRPIANYIIIAICIAIHISREIWEYNYSFLILREDNLIALLTYSFAHIDLMHLSGNMLFLWVFGNAICSKFGNAIYFICYLALSAAAGYIHILLDGTPCIGASGALNGIIGLFLVLYPTNRVSCYYLIFLLVYFRSNTFKITGSAIIGIWFVFDLFGIITNFGNTAYIAHIAGLMGGVTLGFAALIFKFCSHL